MARDGTTSGGYGGGRHLPGACAKHLGVPVVAQQAMNLTNSHEDVGLTPGLARWVKDPALPRVVV